MDDNKDKNQNESNPTFNCMECSVYAEVPPCETCPYYEWKGNE